MLTQSGHLSLRDSRHAVVVNGHKKAVAVEIVRAQIFAIVAVRTGACRANRVTKAEEERQRGREAERQRETERDSPILRVDKAASELVPSVHSDPQFVV